MITIIIYSLLAMGALAIIARLIWQQNQPPWPIGGVLPAPVPLPQSRPSRRWLRPALIALGWFTFVALVATLVFYPGMFGLRSAFWLPNHDQPVTAAQMSRPTTPTTPPPANQPPPPATPGCCGQNAATPGGGNLIHGAMPWVHTTWPMWLCVLLFVLVMSAIALTIALILSPALRRWFRVRYRYIRRFWLRPIPWQARALLGALAVLGSGVLFCWYIGMNTAHLLLLLLLGSIGIGLTLLFNRPAWRRRLRRRPNIVAVIVLAIIALAAMILSFDQRNIWWFLVATNAGLGAWIAYDPQAFLARWNNPVRRVTFIRAVYLAETFTIVGFRGLSLVMQYEFSWFWGLVLSGLFFAIIGLAERWLPALSNGLAMGITVGVSAFVIVVLGGDLTAKYLDPNWPVVSAFAVILGFVGALMLLPRRTRSYGLASVATAFALVAAMTLSLVKRHNAEFGTPEEAFRRAGGAVATWWATPTQQVAASPAQSSVSTTQAPEATAADSAVPAQPHVNSAQRSVITFSAQLPPTMPQQEPYSSPLVEKEPTAEELGKVIDLADRLTRDLKGRYGPQEEDEN